MEFRDRQYDILIDKLINCQHSGLGFSGEGSCKAGNYIFSFLNFFIPLKSTPENISLTNIEYQNCQNLEVIHKNKCGFVVRATVIADGLAYCYFNWEVVF